MTSLCLEVVYEGSALTVYGAVNVDDECLVSSWLAELDLQTKTQFRSRLNRLTSVGYLRSPEEMRILQCPGEPPVHEIKTRSGYRMYVVKNDPHWVATHGTKKPPDRRVCGEAQRARDIWKEAQR